MYCPNCKSALQLRDREAACHACAISFPERNGVWCLLPSDLPDWKRDEAHYHNEFEQDPTEVHQLDRLRNQVMHGVVHDALFGLGDEKHILEVGCGTGRDAAVMVEQGHDVVTTDISVGALREARKTTRRGIATCIAADADHLPFGNDTFDAAFIVAALHHLPDSTTCLRELTRVVHSGGTVIVGIEPNRTWHLLVQWFRPLLCRASHTSEHGGSIADEKLKGFGKQELIHAFETSGLQVVRVVPNWFLTGFYHYALEFLFRMLRLRKRIRTPDLLDLTFLTIDGMIFLIPGLDRLCWHWTVIGKRL